MGLFSKIFKSQSEESTSDSFEIVNSESSSFSLFSGDPYENIIYRSGVDSIAKHGAKLLPIHVVKNGESSERLNKLLQLKPNPINTTYDVLYKTFTHLFLHNNAYIFIERDIEGQPIALYPIDCSNAQFGHTEDNEIYVKFHMKNDTHYLLPYKDIIHIKRYYNSNAITGDSNNSIQSTLQTATVQQEGLEKTIGMSVNVRGILKFTGIHNKDELRRKVEQFKQDYFNINNNGGVLASDTSYEYMPLEAKPISIDKEQLEFIENRIYNSLGINKTIVDGTYTEEQFNSFFESVIEPVSIQLSSEFTKKMFTDYELEFGHSIVFESKRLNFSNLQTRINMIAQVQSYGIFTINEAREMLNLPLLDSEEGNKRYQTLNIVTTDIAEQYQLDMMKNGNLKLDNKLKPTSDNTDEVKEPDESEVTNEGN